MQMADGEILVTGSTQPSMMSACMKAAAIVTDEGGITSHAAVVARELGVICVVGTGVGTRTFRTGQPLKVHSETGMVEVTTEDELVRTGTSKRPGDERVGADSNRCTPFPTSDLGSDAMVLSLRSDGARNARLVGGKAAGLARVSECCRVPEGFCLTTTAYESLASRPPEWVALLTRMDQS